jgi:hypothetical protein
MAARHPDFQERMPEVLSVLNERPDLQHTKDPLEIAYLIASATGAKEAGIKEAYETIGKKQAGGLKPGSRAGQEGDGKITRQWVASLSPEEYEKHRDKILAAQRAGEIA